MPKDLNYNKDITKHYVRCNGWVKPFKSILNYVDKEIEKGKRVDKCKYLTFCAIQAIDVFLFEKKKYLYRDTDSLRLENVYFCENDQESFSIIQRMIGSAEQGFFGDFIKIINQIPLVPNNSNDPFDEPASLEEREEVRRIEVRGQLLSKFPFDVINLDFYGNFFPSSQSRYSDSVQAYKKILEFQKDDSRQKCERFLMFLTVYTPVINEARFVNPLVVNTFESVLLANLANVEFKKAIEKKYDTTDPMKLDLYIKFILGFTKQILFKESYKLGWEPNIKNIMTYDRKHPDDSEYKITSFTIEYTRNENLDNDVDLVGEISSIVLSKYKSEITNIVNDAPENVPSTDKIDSSIISSLEQVVKFRNDFLKSIDVYDENLFE